MAETKNREQAEAAPQGTALQARPCPKDCRRCPMPQQVCCAAMLSFQAFEVMDAVIRRLDAQSADIAALARRLDAIQAPEAELSAPEPVQGDLFAEER